MPLTRRGQRRIYLAAGLIFLGAACARKPDWTAKNDALIEAQNITVRTRDDIPKGRLTPSLPDGMVTRIEKLDPVELAPGATARVYWGKGNLVAWVTLGPNAAIPEETLSGERIMVVMKGEVEQRIAGDFVMMRAVPAETPDGTHGGTARNEFVYLEPGSRNAVRTGPEGAEFVEVSWPPRADYLAKAGIRKAPSSRPKAEFPLGPTVRPGVVHDLYDVQFTELQPGADSRLIAGRGAQLSFLQMSPGMDFAAHLHPEEQLMIVLRGSIDELILDATGPMAGGDLLYLPGGMVHGGVTGDRGCDVLDVFYPPRPDYTEKTVRRLAAFRTIIPEGSAAELFVDGAKQEPGLVFGEGIKWLAGKLYFSSMFFDAQWNGDPKRSGIVAMETNGTFRYVSRGLQTNGLMPLANGNLAVCDMFGHRIVEMTTEGRIVRTLASAYNGKPLDGPNDLAADAKGGLYFTDPQFTPEAKKNQPGRAVYYLNTGGRVLRVIEPNAFGMPNGVVLSPDGQTLYVNNTFDSETFWNADTDKDNFVWAFDVNEDGTLANGRKFGELRLTPEVLERKGRSTSADGMTIDEKGNLYVATYLGVQILSPRGEFLGVIRTPVFPVSCGFGGDDLSTLYIVAYDKVYRVRTNVRGLAYPPK
jgi:gluconolactonase